MANTGIYNFEEQGTLTKPFIIGRVFRLALSVACLHFIYVLIQFGDGVIYSLASNPMTWFAITVAYVLVNHVVNIGFGKKWGRMPQTLLIWVSAGLIMFSLYGEGLILGSPFRYFLLGYLFYFYLHLGVSLLLSVIIGTPGCEMRAFPHLYTIITGKETKEHFCPGFIGDVDKWEKKLFKRN